ncbi:dirigent protein 1-like [Cornus florida]|uniref:dirigent protein 1-like n=1 Tax=Cornus florida TaxID=4283 RepID=UPI00289F759D|nr:dirigent protein 1-like [Cornus florida]
MAPKSITRATKLCLLLLVTMFIYSSAEVGQLKETNMTLYLQDRSAGPNATVVPVTGIPGRLWTFSSFGTMFCSDDPITVGFDKTSAQIGRVQGIFVTSALDGSSTHVSVSIVFTNATYNGSTIQIQGASRQFESVREVAVVGGTGIFRYARGYATFETIYLDTLISYAVIRCNVTVLYY